TACRQPARGVLEPWVMKSRFQRSLRVLVAEDNPTNQLVALRLLEKMGHQPTAVSNGREAVETLAREAFDLVLMDVQMPEMDGFEATRVIRDPNSPVLDHQIPVIAMTAHALTGYREQCLAAGMDDYIAKPVQPEELAQVLERWPQPACDLATGQPVASQTSLSPATSADAGALDRSGVSTGARVSIAGATPAATGAPAATGTPAEGGTGKPPVLDRQALLDRVAGDEDLAAEVLGVFMQDVPRQLAALKKVVAAGDLEQVRRHAHTLKGASANAGALALREAALQCENAAKEGRLADVQGALRALRREFQALRKEVAKQPVAASVRKAE
ncbi:MAG: response regulator, partial [Thermoleophilia bacterium]|nr:response regulator [Thermoleophilia bacterium]